MGIKKTRAGLWILSGDEHFPDYHKPSWNAQLEFLEVNKKRIVGYAKTGDQHDNPEISHHNKRRVIFHETGSYKKNTDGYLRDILNPLEAILPADVEKHWILGNHEHWERQLIEEQPQFEGSIERHLLYDLAGRGWNVHDTGKGFDIGKLHVIHGEALKGSNHAKNAVETYAQSVAYFHFHTNQQWTKILPQGKTDKWVGFACPCMCNKNPVYLRNAPTAWLNGFTIVEVREDGNFNLFQAITSKGQFSYGGRTYGKKG